MDKPQHFEEQIVQGLGDTLWHFLQLPMNRKRGNSLVKVYLSAHKLISGKQTNFWDLQGKDSLVPSWVHGAASIPPEKQSSSPHQPPPRPGASAVDLRKRAGLSRCPNVNYSLRATAMTSQPRGRANLNLPPAIPILTSGTWNNSASRDTLSGLYASINGKFYNTRRFQNTSLSREISGSQSTSIGPCTVDSQWKSAEWMKVWWDLPLEIHKHRQCRVNSKSFMDLFTVSYLEGQKFEVLFKLIIASPPQKKI